jgi:hypothetical protein
MFLQEAKLGGVRGSADLRWRRRSLSNRDWRGTFVFEAEDEPTIAELVDDHVNTTYEALIDGQPKKLSVTVTSFSPIGVAFFEGSGEPF